MTAPEVSLTLVEKLAGRKFKAACLAAWTVARLHSSASPPPPWTVDGFRHDCSGAGSGRLASAEGRTVNIPLQENDWLAPEIDGIPAGTFVFIFMTGRCEACGFKVVSEGHLDVVARRPPRGRVTLIQEVPQ